MVLRKLCTDFFVFRRVKLRNFVSFNPLRWENIYSTKCDLCNGHSYKPKRVWYN